MEKIEPLDRHDPLPDQLDELRQRIHTAFFLPPHLVAPGTHRPLTTAQRVLAFGKIF